MSQIHGQPLKVIKFDNSTLEFDKAALESLLLHPQVKARKVVVLSIVGAFRKGKSFFLDYCLRFLYANVSSTDSS
jgi:atlastin